MDLGLKNRIAFVAGASSGLGFALARELVREGCHVAICSRTEAHVQDAAEALEAEAVGGARVLPLVCDVTDEADVERALAAAADHFGGLHALVTNAGGPASGMASEFTADQWRAGLELNLLSTINLCRHALPHLRASMEADAEPLGRILMVTSISSKQPIPGLALSNTARAGVQGFAKSLAEELGPEGITVNTILPGYTRTERLSELSDDIHARTGKAVDEIEAGWAANNALRRLADPGEFAAAGVFLLSRRASFITGVALNVDGGHSKHLL